MEVFEALSAFWSILPREQKEGLVVFLGSFPLSGLSIGVGLYHSNELLWLSGLTTLLIALLLIVLLGTALLRLVFALLKLLLSLPFRLLRRSSSNDDGEELRREERKERQRWAWFDGLFLGWFLLATLQVVLLLGYLPSS